MNVVHAIEQAHTRVLVAAYTFTSKEIALALLNAHKRGLDVRVVVDAKEAGKGYSAARFLANEGVSVRTNGRYAIHHHKFLVIDDDTVETGSFNYTSAAARRNAENAIVIHGAPEVVTLYAREWHRLWDEARALGAAY